MKVRRQSTNYNFIGDTCTGLTFRWGASFAANPLLAPWPELADISISNHCTNNCDYCYRNSQPDESFMTVEEYKYVLQCLNHPYWGNVFQVALGGGEPLEHPDFLDIIKVTNEFDIVPNFTTNGIHLNREITHSLSGNVGAAAISISDMRGLANINLELMFEYGIRTNLHFLLSNKTIEQAIYMLEGKFDDSLHGLNAIIFLTYKPTGRAVSSNCLIWNENLRRFLQLLCENKYRIRIGFDACFVPLLLHFTNIDPVFVDPCECGRFSVYIDEKLNVKPCSFANDPKYNINLRQYSFTEIWEHKFKDYRQASAAECGRDCKNKALCGVVCPYYDELKICFTSDNQQAMSLW